MMQTIKKFKIAISIFLLALSARVFVFASFWQASKDKGGWDNFDQTDWIRNSLYNNSFTSYCDGQPPLYTAFTTVIRFFWNDRWAIYIAHFAITLVSFYFIYKLLRLYFSKKISVITVGLLAVEPYMAFYNFMFGSENLFILLTAASLYYFFLFLKNGNKKHLFVSAVVISLSSLTRSNSIILAPVLSVLLLFLFLLKNKIKIELLGAYSLKKLFAALLVFNLIYVAVLAPWLIRNKMKYGQYFLAVIISTNIYNYNVPALFAYKNGTSFDFEKNLLHKKAEERLGRKIIDYADCSKFTPQEFNGMLVFYKTQGNKYIHENLFLYTKLHLFKMLPFFVETGYFSMWDIYTHDGAKPDVTSAILKGDIGKIKNFLFGGGPKIFIYIGGMLICGTMSLSIFISFLYSFFKKKETFVFFYFASMIALYSAFVISPFVLARYRLQVSFIFVVSMVYLISVILNTNLFRKKNI